LWISASRVSAHALIEDDEKEEEEKDAGEEKEQEERKGETSPSIQK